MLIIIVRHSVNTSFKKKITTRMNNKIDVRFEFDWRSLYFHKCYSAAILSCLSLPEWAPYIRTRERTCWTNWKRGFFRYFSSECATSLVTEPWIPCKESSTTWECCRLFISCSSKQHKAIGCFISWEDDEWVVGLWPESSSSFLINELCCDLMDALVLCGKVLI